MDSGSGRRSIDLTVLLRPAVVLAMLLLAAYVGLRGSVFLPFLVLLGAGALLLLARPGLGVPLLVVAALALPYEVATGTEVTLNLATLLVPAVAVAWALGRLLRRDLHFAPSHVNRPLVFFLLAGLLSLGIGNALWDPAVPRSGHFALVQWAQWGLYALSALAFWLGANLLSNRRWLEQATWTFLWLGGGLAILRVIVGFSGQSLPLATIAIDRAPFWTLLGGLCAGQLLYHERLGGVRRAFVWLCLAAVLWYVFVAQRAAASNWMGVVATLAVLLWLRYPRLRWPVALLLGGLVIAGTLIPAVYQFAGGDDEWFLSGGSRMALMGRVLAVAMRNPITGLGPASYRNYAAMQPLRYGTANWLAPQISSHNNYVDLFARFGVLGLGLFLWVAVAMGQTAWRAGQQAAHSGFLRGYAAGMAAVGVGALLLMLMADWILPFVYNIGFPGFQASVLVWLFMGGLAALEQMEAAD